MMRNKTKKIRAGNLYIGGKSPVSVQSMTNTDTHNVNETVRQIKKLEKAGCELVRVAVPDLAAARLLGRIKGRVNIPVSADIHFDYRLALEAIKQGVDKLRLNPGNIGGPEKVKPVAVAAGKAGIPIRIGVNSGSLEKTAVKDLAGAMAASALKHVRLLEKFNFHDIVISLKSSDVRTTINAYRKIAEKTSYPLHLGVTEAGPEYTGTVKSAVALGVLLSEGIGDTIRVSLTADPVEEVRAGFEILKALGLRKRGLELISCPTCGRCRINIIKIASQVQEGIDKLSEKYPELPSVKIAVMGCVVNGPGEAKAADIGIAGGRNSGVLFKGGRVVRKVKEKDLVRVLLSEVKKHINKKEK